jgi:hypothetical protein
MLELAPKNPMLLNNLAWALGKLNDKSALEVAQQALAWRPTARSSSTLTAACCSTTAMREGCGNPAQGGQPGAQAASAACESGPRAGEDRRQGRARKELDEAQKLAPEKSPLRAEIDKVRASL